MSIFSRLIELGYTREQIEDAARERGGSRTVTLAFSEQPGAGADPIVGVTYVCDFRAEEEYGVKDLYKALDVGAGEWVMGSKRTGHVTNLGRDGVLVVATQPISQTGSWGDLLMRPEATTEWDRIESEGYAEYWARALKYTQGSAELVRWGRETDLKVVELKAKAETYGVSLTGLRKKTDMVAAIKSSESFRASRSQPNTWPGWFHYGKALALRADDGVVHDVLRMLFEAGQNGTLAFGGGSQVFGSGLSLYDGMDVSRELNAERKAHAKWVARAEKKLNKAIPAIRKVGSDKYTFGYPYSNRDGKNEFGWYFLGNPRAGFKDVIRHGEDGTYREDADESATYYWLNGHGVKAATGRTRQPSGWYTIADLLAGKHLEDMEHEAVDNYKTFDDSGNYRNRK